MLGSRTRNLVHYIIHVCCTTEPSVLYDSWRNTVLVILHLTTWHSFIFNSMGAYNIWSEKNLNTAKRKTWDRCIWWQDCTAFDDCQNAYLKLVCNFSFNIRPYLYALNVNFPMLFRYIWHIDCLDTTGF